VVTINRPTVHLHTPVGSTVHSHTPVGVANC